MLNTHEPMTAHKIATRIEDDPELRALYKRVGRRIRQLRLRAGLTQREASAAAFGTDAHQSEWSRWEAGHMLPNIATLHRIATWAGTSLGDLGLYEPVETLTKPDIEALRHSLKDALRIVERSELAGEGKPARATKRRTSSTHGKG